MRKVYGLAVPYNTANSYNETIAPGAFCKQFSGAQDISLPMLIQHDDNWKVGMWTRVVDAPEGVFFEGEIEDDFIADFLTKKKAGLSITYSNDSPSRHIKALSAVMSGKRKFPPETVTEAEIMEVSFTPKPAFPKTWYHILKGDKR